MLYIVACIMLALYAFGISPDSVNLGWLGLAVLAIAPLTGNWPFNYVAARRE